MQKRTSEKQVNNKIITILKAECVMSQFEATSREQLYCFLFSRELNFARMERAYFGGT